MKLKEELLQIIDEEVDEDSRGEDAAPEVAEDILEVIQEIDDDGGGAVGWGFDPMLSGTWRLLYTSSKRFAANTCLTGYALDVPGVSQPDLLMTIMAKEDSGSGELVFEEPLEFQEGSFASLAGRLANVQSVKVACSWTEASNLLRIDPKSIKAGTMETELSARQAKNIRIIRSTRPIFLDEELLVLRAEPDYVNWVFERV